MSHNEFKHLHPDFRPIAAHGKEERVNWIRSQPRWIDYPVAAQLQSQFQEVLIQPRSARMENILLYEESGVGKTNLMHAFMAKNPPKYPSPSRMAKQHPIIKVLMPPEPDHMDLYRGILRALEIPYFERNHFKLLKIQDVVR